MLSTHAERRLAFGFQTSIAAFQQLRITAVFAAEDQPRARPPKVPLNYNLDMAFPENRMRRMRRTEPLRALVRETALDPGDLIYPLFICPGEGVRNPV